LIFNIKLVENSKFSFWFLAEKYKEAIEKAFRKGQGCEFPEIIVIFLAK